MKKIFTVLFLSSFLFISCGKYENGPKFTLLSKKARLANSWKLERATQDGVLLQFNANAYTNTTVISKDNGYDIIAESSQNGFINQYGTWEFGENKETIIIDLPQSGYTDEFIISKLENKSLWLEKKIGSSTYLYEYVPK